ncbi:nuclear transport factor 2 family protein [Actinomadura fulvescens]|uniref:SnoaL-like domain-containing protein n=1 Tax=Actinomadura fulvescens TaxID=46160 RepID=A0ABP6CF50_9ACTN
MTVTAGTRFDAFVDRVEIIELVDRYMLSLDEAVIDEEWAARFHTADIATWTPVGNTDRLDGIADATRVALERFQRTQHFAANHIVDLDGDRASVRWNALMIHLHLDETQASRGEPLGGHFDVGGIFQAEVVRTRQGWKFRRLDVRPVWLSGRPPVFEVAGS